MVVDSGAGIHLTPCSHFIKNLRRLKQPIKVRAAFGTIELATHGGEGEIQFGTHHTLHLHQIIYCPHLRDTLLSYVLLCKAGHRVEMTDRERYIH